MSKGKVICIGSGLGTLVSATILSRYGYEVLVLEKNKQLGGNLQVFSRDKTVFDTGVHYLGGLKKGQNLHQIFNYLKIMEQLNFERMDTTFEQVYLSGNQTEAHHLAQGKTAFISQLSSDFPEEKEAIHAYFDYLVYTCQQFPLYQLKWAPSTIDEKVLQQSVTQVLDHFFQSPEIKKVILSHRILYGSHPDETPWYIHALISYSYIQGAFRLKNGASQIIKLLSKQIRAHGGELLKEKEVVDVAWEDTSIKSVICADGSTYSGDYFIFNIHPKQILRFLPEAFKKRHQKRMVESPETPSSFSVYISLERNQVAYRNHNKMIYFEAEGKEQMMMLSYISDPKNNAYASGLSILSLDYIQSYEAWKDSFHTTAREKSRPEAYENYKSQKAAQLIQIVSHYDPELMPYIRTQHTASPLSYRDYIDGVEGSMYGIQKHLDLTKSIQFDVKTNLKNVFLVGQNVSLHGILGVSIGAIKTCFQFIPPETLMKAIEKEGNEEK